MRLLTIATTQMPCTWDLPSNLDRAEQLVRDAAAKGAQVILLQELFATPYFCIEQRHQHLALAEEYQHSQVLKRFAALAKELGVVLPLSWFEKAGNAFFNSLSVADADGRLLGVYRKSHIPNAIGYQEKEYFSPGDTGFRVWDSAFGRLGIGICWDQWFPETARCLALQGRRGTAVSHRHRFGTRLCQPRFPRPLADDHARARGGQPAAGGGGQPRRARSGEQ